MSFNIQIISPEETIFNDEIDMVIIPGSEGDFGILSNHMPLISTLRLGIIYIYRNKKVFKKFLVNGGLAEISDNKCILLTEEITAADSTVAINDDDPLKKRKSEILTQKFYS